MNSILQTIKFIAKQIQWKTMITNPLWFFSMHFPHMFSSIVEAPFMPRHKNHYWNTRIYDGLTRNDFIKGDLIEKLHKMGCIKKLDWESDDGRGYFIGCTDDD